MKENIENTQNIQICNDIPSVEIALVILRIVNQKGSIVRISENCTNWGSCGICTSIIGWISNWVQVGIVKCVKLSQASTVSNLGIVDNQNRDWTDARDNEEHDANMLHVSIEHWVTWSKKSEFINITCKVEERFRLYNIKIKISTVTKFLHLE